MTIERGGYVHWSFEPSLGLECNNGAGAITRLGSDALVFRVPRYSLDKVLMMPKVIDRVASIRILHIQGV